MKKSKSVCKLADTVSNASVDDETSVTMYTNNNTKYRAQKTLLDMSSTKCQQNNGQWA